METDLYEVLRLFAILDQPKLCGTVLKSAEAANHGVVVNWAETPIDKKVADILISNGFVTQLRLQHGDTDYYLTPKGSHAHPGLRQYYEDTGKRAIAKSGKSTSSLLGYVCERAFWTMRGCPENHPRKNEICMMFNNPFGERFAFFRDGDIVVLPKGRVDSHPR